MHGFTDVDAQPRPERWVQVLDRLADEPFYQAYQRRLRELLRPVPGACLIEVGAGAGTSAALLEAEYRARVVAVDRGRTLTAQMRARGLRRVVVADAHDLPFPDGSFDGAWTDRTLQHLSDPGRALDELVRVTRRGGRLALADPDYDTQVLDIADRELARQVLRFRADTMLRHGTLAHQHAGLLADRGVTDVEVEPRTLVVRDPAAVDNVLGLRTWAKTAAAQGKLAPAAAERFRAQFDEAVASGHFTYAVTFFITAGTVP
jgi:SAM-dependent methyltransferase